MKLTPLVVIVSICFLLTLFPVFYKFENGILKLPQCKKEKPVETIVDFFISESVWSSYSVMDINERINSAINSANLILKNTCIPMRRRLGDIYQVDMTLKSFFEPEVDDYHNKLIHEMESTIAEYNHTQLNRYYAVVVDDLPNNILGVTDPHQFPQFLILSIRADNYTLEHELGHLAYAWHDDDSWGSKLTVNLEKNTPEENKDKLHSYARGYNCGKHRTIMSQKSNYNNQLPIYSSPEIFYGDEACGDPKYGDNARQLREYAYQLREKLKIHQ